MIETQKGNENYDEIKQYISQHPKSVINKYREMTALLFCCFGYDYKLIKLLVNAGSNINKTDDVGWSAIMIVCRYGKPDCIIKTIKFLVHAGCDLNIHDDSGTNALIYSCMGETNSDIISVLLNCDLNTKNIDGNTALMCACSNGDLNIYNVRLLISAECNLDLQDNLGNTALMYACSSNCTINTIRLLIDAGCNVNIKNNKGDTALDLCCKWGIANQKSQIIGMLMNAHYDAYVKDSKNAVVDTRKQYISSTLAILDIGYILCYDGNILSLDICGDIFMDIEEVLND